MMLRSGRKVLRGAVLSMGSVKLR